MTISETRKTELQTRGGAIYRNALQEKRKLTDVEQNELRTMEQELDRSEYEMLNGDPTPSEAQRRFTAGATEQRSTKRELRPGEVRTYAPTDRMVETPYDGPGLGTYLRGMVTGNWDGAGELRAMAEGTGAAGGFTVPTPLSLTTIDMVRNSAQVINAGAVTVPMGASTLKMARLAADVSAGWRAENAPVTFSDNTFEQVTFTAQTLAAGAKISLEVLEDAYGIDAIVSNSIAKALALELDRAALYGTGSANMPRGIKAQTGVTLTDLATDAYTLVDYSKFSAALAVLQGYNFTGPHSMIHSARTAGVLDNLQDTLHQPLRMPDAVAAVRRLISNQIPNNLTHGASNVTSDCFCGQFNQLLIGLRTSLVMEVSREAADASGSSFSNMQCWIRAYLRCDFQLQHPKAFNVLCGIA